MTTPQPIPDTHRAIMPYITVKDPEAAIEFYKRAFGARETLILKAPDGGITHAELMLGEGPLMLSGEYAEHGALSPVALGGTSCTFARYVEDVDAAFEQAVAAGAQVLRPVSDQFYGDRTCKLKDPFGHNWALSTRKEDMSNEEMQQRMNRLYEK